MGFVWTVLAMFSFFIAPIAGWVAFRSFCERDLRVGFMSAAVSAVALSLWLSAPKSESRYSAECWIDWDGRTNPTVCD